MRRHSNSNEVLRLHQRTMHVKVKKLDMRAVKPHRISLLLGRRGSGKSVLLRDILHHTRDRYDFALAMCPTLESSDLLKEHMPACCVFDRYVQSKVDSLVKLASEVAAAGKPRNFLLILDDVMYDKAICRTQSFRYLFYNGRHARITCILLLQYLVDMPPDMFYALGVPVVVVPAPCEAGVIASRAPTVTEPYRRPCESFPHEGSYGATRGPHGHGAR